MARSFPSSENFKLMPRCASLNGPCPRNLGADRDVPFVTGQNAQLQIPAVAVRTASCGEPGLGEKAKARIFSAFGSIILDEAPLFGSLTAIVSFVLAKASSDPSREMEFKRSCDSSTFGPAESLRRAKSH